MISITDTAAIYIKDLLKKDKKKPIGIRVNIQSAGCSGNKYRFEYIYEENECDEEVRDKGVRIFINPNIILKIFGTQLDYIDKKIKSGLIFINPNEKGRCGCGESVLLWTYQSASVIWIIITSLANLPLVSNI